MTFFPYADSLKYLNVFWKRHVIDDLSESGETIQIPLHYGFRVDKRDSSRLKH